MSFTTSSGRVTQSSTVHKGFNGAMAFSFSATQGENAKKKTVIRCKMNASPYFFNCHVLLPTMRDFLFSILRLNLLRSIFLAISQDLECRIRPYVVYSAHLHP